MGGYGTSMIVIGDDGRWYRLTPEDLEEFALPEDSPEAQRAKPYVEKLRHRLHADACIIAVAEGTPHVIVDLKKAREREDA